MLLETNVIEGAYLQDILEQPSALGRTWAGLTSNTALTNLAADFASGKYERIVLTGMGSSLFALYPLHLCLIDRGYSSLVVETAELIHYQSRLLNSRTLVVAVSQSGQSAEVVRLAEIADRRCPLVAITNSENSILARQADATLLLHAGPESTVSCKTYLSSLLALEWLGAIFTSRDLFETKDELSAAIPAVRHYLAEWRQHVADLAPSLMGIEQIFVTGRGPSLATAQTGGLILKESTRCSAEGISCAAFRHGPFEMLSRHVMVLIIAGDSRSESLNRRLANDVDQAGGVAGLIAENAPLPVFRIPRVTDSLRTLVEILPVQMLSLALAARNGTEAGKFSLARKITDIE